MNPVKVTEKDSGMASGILRATVRALLYLACIAVAAVLLLVFR